MKIRKPGAEAPITIDLPEGASITLRPWRSAALAAGQAAFNVALQAGLSRADATVAFSAGAVAWAAIDWSGMEDFDTGEPLPISPEMVEQLVIQDAGAFSELDEKYVLPGLRREQEKNGSAPSPVGGTPAGATTDA
ncbi:hypothetical protein [Caulobacter sp. BP25]|uniref:hypothetical protein n=1 Tax=Caulobacter sp. BP25 TaxID=2048900 RepID=UPI000C12AA9B|nr:hypothetical protein [Caulobacter sp. BP25]PHY20928.1 hypothetical protein CSW59_06885 [Caulobacter sp. BP25]